jgi:AcrR family transcriptional regulator
MVNREANSTKRHIVDCAISLYKEHGFNNVTVQDICNRSGITRSAFYYHFKTKDEILDNYYLYSDILELEHLETLLLTDNYLEQFYHLFNLYLERTAAAGPELFGQILKHSIDTETPVLDPQGIALRHIYSSLIKKAQEAGQIQNGAPAEELVDAIVYLADGIAFIWSHNHGKIDLISEMRRMLDILFMRE